MATKRLQHSNNNVGSRVPFVRAVLGSSYASLGGVSSFTRGDASTCATQQSAGGVWATVLANILRDAHYINGIRTILLEESRQNVIVHNESILTASGWNVNSGFETVTGGQADNRGANNASDIGISSPPHNTSALFRVPTLSSVAYAVSCFVAPGASGSADMDLFDATAGTHYGVRISAWNGAAAPTAARINAVGTMLASVAAVNGFWRLGYVSPAVVSTDTIRFYMHPSPVAGIGDSIFADPQVEAGTFPTSPIATGAAAVTRAVDALTFAGVPMVGTLFYHYFDLATQAWVSVAAAYAGNTPIVPPINRAYDCIAVLKGTFTAEQCKAILGGNLL